MQKFSNNLNNNNNNISNDVDEKVVRQLPDILRDNLDMVVVGITPSGALGISNHHFSGPGNHFWRCIYEVGIVPMSVTCEDDFKMLDYGIGFISFCTRPSKGGTELSRKEMKAGAAIMMEKIKIYKPKIVVFNGIGIYEAFLGNKNFSMGLQPARLDGTDSLIFVMPSSSARCAQLPRAEDKIPFFVSLKKLRDHLKGDLPHLEEKEVIFENYTEFRVTQPDPRSLLKAERRRKRKAEQISETTNPDHNTDNIPKEFKKIEESKTVVDHVKEEKVLVQQSISLSISNTNSAMTMTSPMTMASSPILSWPHAGGLTIIHTGQQIIMPTVTQSATTNTLLLFDPNGLSFSSIPVPVNHSHLQVRPMIISNEADSKGITSQPMAQSTPKQNDTSNTIVSSASLCFQKNRNQQENLKPISIKSVQKVTSYIETIKPIVSSIPVLSTPTRIDPNINSNIFPVKVESEISKEIPFSSLVSAITEVPCMTYNPLEDPINDWELFIKGINTGECTYPAPPQAVPIVNLKAIEEFNEVSQSICRVLTVL